MPQNSKTDGMGWKAKEGCAELSGEEYIQCIEAIAFTKEDIFTNFAYEELKANTYFVGWFEAFGQFLEIDNGYITNDFYSTMAVSLNNSLSYQILIMDPKIKIFSNIPQAFPITRIALMNEYVCALQVYLKVHTCRMQIVDKGDELITLKKNLCR